jgi:rhodanese-related sulfurtransferase
MKGKWLAILLLILVFGCAGMETSSQGQAPRMAKEQLKARLGSAELVIIDARSDMEWTESDQKIAGAVREAPEKFDDWKNKYPASKTLVLYCS